MNKPICFIIEDNEELGDIFSHALRMENYDVELIPNGDDAIERLNEAVPDLVLLDMFLPGKNGEHILNHIRQDARLANSRVVVVTAYPQAARFLSAKPKQPKIMRAPGPGRRTALDWSEKKTNYN
ncbi:MAG: response regulator [Chloroflexota bacterium]